MKKQKIEVGTKVKITDLSYSKLLDKDGLSKPVREALDSVYEVIAVGCILPAPLSSPQTNTVIIREVDNGVCIFTQERFLKATHCNCCGQKLPPRINIEIKTHCLGSEISKAMEAMQHDLFRPFMPRA